MQNSVFFAVNGTDSEAVGSHRAKEPRLLVGGFANPASSGTVSCTVLFGDSRAGACFDLFGDVQ